MKYFRPKYKKWYFPSGETGVKVLEYNTNDIMILDYAEEKDLMAWFQIIDSYNRHCPTWKKSLFIPYFPYARQDKLHRKGEAISLVILDNILRNLGCHVHVLDLHSNYYPLGPSQENISIVNRELVDILNHIDIFCFPDKNAKKHGLLYQEAILCSHANFNNAIVMEKNRSLETGQIISCYITNKGEYTVPTGSINIMINDDICDGGATFVHAAKALREEFGARIHKLGLFVTHGLFTQGFMYLIENGIDHIYTTNSYCKFKSNEYITVFDIFTGTKI